MSITPNPANPFNAKAPVQAPTKDLNWSELTKDKKAYTHFCQFARKMGFVKEAKDPEAIKRLKIAWFTFMSVFMGDLIVFFTAAIVGGAWSFTPIMYQALLISLVKNVQIVIIGKIIKYLENKTNKEPLEDE